MKKLLISVVLILTTSLPAFAGEIDMKRLNAFAKQMIEGYRQQAAQILKNADYLKQRFDEINYPAWKNDFSNTVFFRRPSQWVMEKWDLAPDEDTRLGGRLAHDIVMQHEGKETIDLFIEDIKKDVAATAKGAKP